MDYVVTTLVLSCLLFAGILGAREVGRRLGRRAAMDALAPDEGSAAIQAAVFGLYGLLVAFTFGSALTRFEARRALIVEEANAIDTAWALLDVLPAPVQAALRDRMRRYVDARVDAHRYHGDWDAVARHEGRASGLADEIWSASVEALRADGFPPTTPPLLQALSAMPDVAARRAAALRQHQPTVVLYLLVAFALGSALTSGYAGAHQATRKWFHGLVFAAVSALSFFVILDIEHPRRGLFRIDEADQALLDVRASMDPPGR